MTNKIIVKVPIEISVPNAELLIHKEMEDKYKKAYKKTKETLEDMIESETRDDLISDNENQINALIDLIVEKEMQSSFLFQLLGPDLLCNLALFTRDEFEGMRTLYPAKFEKIKNQWYLNFEAIFETSEDRNKADVSQLLEYISGQMSDGYGEDGTMRNNFEVYLYEDYRVDKYKKWDNNLWYKNYLKNVKKLKPKFTNQFIDKTNEVTEFSTNFTMRMMYKDLFEKPNFKLKLTMNFDWESDNYIVEK